MLNRRNFLASVAALCGVSALAKTTPKKKLSIADFKAATVPAHLERKEPDAIICSPEVYQAYFTSSKGTSTCYWSNRSDAHSWSV